MSTAITPDPAPVLEDVEQQAVAVALDIYRTVGRAPALDAPDHWERYANRLKSSAYAVTAQAFLEQVARRFGVAHTPGPAVVALVQAEPVEARRVLRVLREHANAVSVLVRDARDAQRSAR